MVIGGYLFIAFIVTYRLVPETLKRKQTNNDDTEMGEELLTHDALIENEIENDNENEIEENVENEVVENKQMQEKALAIEKSFEISGEEIIQIGNEENEEEEQDDDDDDDESVSFKNDFLDTSDWSMKKRLMLVAKVSFLKIFFLFSKQIKTKTKSKFQQFFLKKNRH